MGILTRLKLWRERRNNPELKRSMKHYKQEIRKIYMITQLQQEFIFVIGLFVGILSGLLGNYFVTSYFRWKDGIISDNLFYFSFILLCLVFFLLIIWLWSIHKRAVKKYWKLVEDKGIED